MARLHDAVNYLSKTFWFYYNDRIDMLKRGTLLGTFVVQMLYISLYICVSGLLPILLLVLLFWYPSLVPLYLAYTLWLWFDWNTPSTGGRPLKYCFVRRWRMFNIARKYFPITLKKTADLDPEKNYIFGYHLHGMISDGAVVSFSTESSEFQTLFPGIQTRLSMHSFFNWIFLFREFILALGIISVSRDSLKYELTQNGPGHSVVIIIGGSSDVINTTHSAYIVTINKRKGFVKLALETGSHLVPVFAFGQNDLFRQPRTIFSPRIDSWLPKWPKIILKYSLVAHHDRSTFGVIPRPHPIHVVVGSPIHVKKVPHPTQQEVDDLHATYIEELVKLFNTQKEKYEGADNGRSLIFDKN